jgi:hypothetical protein
MKRMGIRTNQCLPKNLVQLKRQLRRPRDQSGTTRLCSVSFVNDDQNVAQIRSTVQSAIGLKNLNTNRSYKSYRTY